MRSAALILFLSQLSGEMAEFYKLGKDPQVWLQTRGLLRMYLNQTSIGLECIGGRYYYSDSHDRVMVHPKVLASVGASSSCRGDLADTLLVRRSLQRLSGVWAQNGYMKNVDRVLRKKVNLKQRVGKSSKTPRRLASNK